jgi:hypothetical protein
MKQEIEILKSLQHPNIVNWQFQKFVVFQWVCDYQARITIAMIMPNGTNDIICHQSKIIGIYDNISLRAEGRNCVCRVWPLLLTAETSSTNTHPGKNFYLLTVSGQLSFFSPFFNCPWQYADLGSTVGGSTDRDTHLQMFPCSRGLCAHRLTP